MQQQQKTLDIPRVDALDWEEPETETLDDTIDLDWSDRVMFD